MEATQILQVLEGNERARLKSAHLDLPAALAHNLKSPLVGTDMILNSLLREGQGPLTSQQSQSLQLIKDSNLHVLEMVQELIEIYRFETNSARLNFQRVKLAELINESLKTFEKRSIASSITLSASASTDIVVSADQQAFKRLLDNLLENAIKHTSAGGTVHVDSHIIDKNVEITVRDTGCGIALENPNILFHRFWQGEPGKTYAAVTGLGLYLCRQIVEAHGGEIKVSSKLNSGTVFSITIPVNNL
jgi:two-component system, sensor histidine kinase and response regulator